MLYYVSRKTVGDMFPDYVLTTEGRDLLCADPDGKYVIRIFDAQTPAGGGAWKYTVTEKGSTEPTFECPGYFAALPVDCNDPDRPLVIAICGASGSGKTTLAQHLKERYGIHDIVSYTTRPMRETETDGKEHRFVTESEMPPKERMLAYTFFGGNHYWADLKEIEDNKTCTYTIDESGIIDLHELERQGRLQMFWIQIERPENPTDTDRKQRDECRAEATRRLHDMDRKPDALITNDYSDVTEFAETEGRQIAEFLTMRIPTNFESSDL